MTNGHIRKAEIEAILSGGREKVDRFLVESVVELKEGLDKQHNLLEDHCVEANVRDQRLEELEEWRRVQASTCVDRVKKLIHEEHEARHNTYIATLPPHRATDPEDADYSGDRRVWLMWQIGSKISYILMAVLITALNIIVHYALMGEP